jgi:hypothetical protein
MIDKTLVYVLIGAGLVILLVGGLLGWYVKPEKTCPIIQDTLYVQGDTLLVPYPVEIIKWREKQPAVIIEKEYTAKFDSEFVSHRDTIDIKSIIGFDDSSKIFDMDMDVKHKDFESIRVDTIKVNYIETKEIEVNNPDWITATVTSTVLLLLAIIALIAGG